MKKDTEAWAKFEAYLATIQSNFPGNSTEAIHRQSITSAQQPGTLMSEFRVLDGLIYPLVIRTIGQLKKQGISTPAALANADLSVLEKKRKFGPTIIQISRLLQAICQADIQEDQ